MPAVRKTTHFTDGALFSSLSHPLFLSPLLVISSCYLSLSPRPVPFPVLLPGSVSPVPLLILSTIPFLLLFTFPFQLRLQFSLPTPPPSPFHPSSPLPFPFHFSSRLPSRFPSISVSISAPSTVPIPVSDTVFWAQKCVSRTEKPSLPAKFCSDTGFSAQKSVSRAAALSFRFE